ncbi:OadG family protein [Ignavibacterium sp.]|jgi:Na+-transporting methylmalonyl-CoA/oxaloacetate decarboxylase gamma subunit|uniref:OadG family protein n=1 Tax=Ignavibacterium sp. TaxID=2651167 RepID=UPI0025C3CA2C|nr:OadG family protein [Ignavibacterium sp.]
MVLAEILQITQTAADTTIVKVHRNSELFIKIDPYGIGMTVIGYTIVFIALFLLYIVFYNLTRVLTGSIKRLFKKDSHTDNEKPAFEISGEVNAAIAAALYLYYNELHDQENTVLTINRVSRAYSPWSSKIYSLRQYPR